MYTAMQSSGCYLPTSQAECTNNERSQLSTSRRLGLVFLACLQNSLLGGLIFGWPSIDNGLLSAAPEDGGAGLTRLETTKLFSYASLAAMTSSLFLGGILDHLGPRVCSCFSILAIAFGCLLFMVNADHDYAVYAVATICIGSGGPGIQMSIAHLANLFPEHSYLVLSAAKGTITISFAVFVVFDWLWRQHGYTIHILFGWLCLVSMVLLAASIVFWPDEPYPTLRSKHTHASEVEATHIHPDSFLLSRDPSLDAEQITTNKINKIYRSGDDMYGLKSVSLQKKLSSSVYWRSVVFLLVASFVANFYVVSFSTELADLQYYSVDDEHGLIRLFTLIMSTGVIGAVGGGYLMDRLGLNACMVLTIVLAIVQLSMLLFLSQIRFYLIASFMLYSLFRQMLFPVYIASVSDHFGWKHFGVLNGIGFILSGFSQPLMPLLLAHTRGTCHHMVSEFCTHGLWMKLHVFEIVCLLVLLLVPYFNQRQYKQSIYLEVDSGKPSNKCRSTEYATLLSIRTEEATLTS